VSVMFKLSVLFVVDSLFIFVV